MKAKMSAVLSLGSRESLKVPLEVEAGRAAATLVIDGIFYHCLVFCGAAADSYL